MLTERERRNIDRVKTWAWTWNTAVDRMVDDCYAPDCVVVNMMSGVTLRGREALRQVEHAMQAFDGTRRMEITRMVACDNVVAVQVDAYWGSVASKACIFLTFGDDGLIVEDHSYGQDPSGASTPRSPTFTAAA